MVNALESITEQDHIIIVGTLTFTWLDLCFSLVYDEERKWTDSNIDTVALKHFPNIDRNSALARPILYSNWLSKDYIPVDREELREFTRARLKVWSR